MTTLFLGTDGTKRDRASHVAYLRRCARSWRTEASLVAPHMAWGKTPAQRSQDCLDQATRVDKLADLVEAGELPVKTTAGG